MAIGPVQLIVLGFLDYPNKRVGLGPTLWPSGSIHHDMAAIRAFYADKIGKHPEQFTAPKLREEEDDARSRLTN